MSEERTTDQGVFIAVESVDGAARDDQMARLAKQLRDGGYGVEVIDFARPGQSAAYFAGQYDDGAYGPPDAVNPYVASLFYALNCFDAAGRVRQTLARGGVVLGSRYAASTMADQGARFHYREERRGYFLWLDNLEFSMMGLPRPDVNIVLRLPAAGPDDPADTGQASVPPAHAQPAGPQQIAEAYDDLCQLFPRDFSRIDVLRSGQPLAEDAIAKLIAEKVQPLLPEPPSQAVSSTTVEAVIDIEHPPRSTHAASEAGQDEAIAPTAPDYFIPAGFDAATANHYRLTMAQLVTSYGVFADSLRRHLSAGDPAGIHRLASRLLPVATSGLANELEKTGSQAALRTLLGQQLPAAHTSVTGQSVRLLTSWPANELDLAGWRAYSVSDLPYSQLQTAALQWPYQLKAGVLGGSASDLAPVLGLSQHHWEITAAIEDILALEQLVRGAHVLWQPLSPRLGYDVPAELEAAGHSLSDQFEACFDTSLALYSLLQRNGFAAEAQQAVLRGHNARVVFSCSAEALAATCSGGADSSQPVTGSRAPLGRQLVDSLAEVNPLLAEALTGSSS